MVILIREQISTKGKTFFNEVNRISIRIVFTFKTTKPQRNTVVYQYEERKEENDLKKRLKRRSIDSRLIKEKSSLSFLEISEVTTDSAEIMPVII